MRLGRFLLLVCTLAMVSGAAEARAQTDPENVSEPPVEQPAKLQPFVGLYAHTDLYPDGMGPFNGTLDLGTTVKGEHVEFVINTHHQTIDRLVADLLEDLSGVEEKLLALADAFGQAQSDWRPFNGVRSGAEVFMHVARINYSVTLFVGHEILASTALARDAVTPSACGLRRSEGCRDVPAIDSEYENSVEKKSDVRAELSASFESVRSAIAATSTSQLKMEVHLRDSTLARRQVNERRSEMAHSETWARNQRRRSTTRSSVWGETWRLSFRWSSFARHSSSRNGVSCLRVT